MLIYAGPGWLKLNISLKINRPGGLELTRKAVSACNLVKGCRVLDAGCGFGVTVKFLRQVAGLHAVGVDACPERLGQGRKARSFPAAAATLEALPFGAAVFDAVFCECVLSLVPDKALCLKNFFELLTPGGRLVITDLVLPGDIASNGAGPFLTCLDGALTLYALVQAIENAGFKVICTEEHTRLLKQMACEMVFEHGSLDAFWQSLTGDVINSGLAGLCRRGKVKPEYWMLIANKTD